MVNKFRKLAERQEKELEVLAADLCNLSIQLKLSEEKKSSIKANLFRAIENGNTELPVELYTLGENIRNFSQESLLSNYKKHVIWAEVKYLIENKIKKNINMFAWAMRNWRAGMASLLIFVFSLGIFVLTPLDLRLTRASKWTFLEYVQGKVFVNRDGKILAVDKNFNLEEGDLVFTDQNSFVTIRFLDDSVARLGADTSLEIKKLYVRPDNAVSTQVELALTGGQIWASVYNLLDNDSKFVVETDKARAKVNSKAAFEMKTDHKSTTLAVYDNVVDFSSKKAKVDQVQPVISGYNAKVDQENSFQIAYSDHDIVLQKNSVSTSDQWVQLNMGLDKQHEEVLKKENSEFVDSAVANENGALGVLADFKDTTKALFNNTEVEQAHQKFLNAELGIIKAKQLIEQATDANNNRRLATPLMLQYKTAIREIIEGYDNLKTQDSVQADQLIAQMQESVDAQRKSLILVLPNEKLYTVKEVVNDASSYFARNNEDQAAYLLARARNKLYEVESMINKGDLKGADAGFRVYLNQLDKLLEQITVAKATQIEAGLFDLLEEQIKQFKVLNVIENKSLEVNDLRLATLVKSVNKGSLNKLISIVKGYRKNGIPFSMLMELNNTVQSYFTDETFKAEALNDLNVIMQGYPEYERLQTSEEPQATTVVNSTQGAIVDFNATKDISLPNANVDLNTGKEITSPDETVIIDVDTTKDNTVPTEKAVDKVDAALEILQSTQK